MTEIHPWTRMHQAVIDFFQFVKRHCQTYFTNGKLVLDVGSGNVNGSNRQFFDSSCKIYGNDIVAGKDVDLVVKTAELPFYKPTFDTVVSSECFQHDPEYALSIRKAIDVLLPGGLFVCTVATTGCPEHGTRKNRPERSLATKAGLPKWRDYYRPLIFDDFRKLIAMDAIFSQYGVYTNTETNDLFLWAVKADPRRPTYRIAIPPYTGPTIQQIAPVQQKPEDTKLEDTKPEDTKPEDTKPEETKPDQEQPLPQQPQPVTFAELSADEQAVIARYLASIGKPMA